MSRPWGTSGSGVERWVDGLVLANELAGQSVEARNRARRAAGRLAKLSTLTRGRELCKVDPDVDVVPSWRCRRQGFAGGFADGFRRRPHVQRPDRGGIDVVEHGQDADELVAQVVRASRAARSPAGAGAAPAPPTRSPRPRSPWCAARRAGPARAARRRRWPPAPAGRAPAPVPRRRPGPSARWPGRRWAGRPGRRCTRPSSSITRNWPSVAR